MALSRGDDYPIHQTPDPVAYSGTDRNFYDRYFFNGYAPDGSSFFAVAFGVYPHLDVADAHFCVSAAGCSIACMPAEDWVWSGWNWLAGLSASKSLSRCKNCV